MSSSARIDYSIRQNKAIERSIVFDGLRSLYAGVHPQHPLVYIGFGSVWFTDFHLAHRHLGIDRMISIELDEITAKRAEFNKPYRTIDVIQGDSNDVIPDLLKRDDLVENPWIAWLDYDKVLDEDRLQQLDDLIRYMPDGSTVVTTFSGTPGQYGRPNQRVRRVQNLLDFAAPSDLTDDDVRDEDDLSRVLADSLERRLRSISIDAGRTPAVPSFRMRYRDGTPMVTVGLHLPTPETSNEVRAIVNDPSWPGIVGSAITTPPLTTREVGAIRALLPTSRSITRADIQDAGFDLEEDQLEAFTAHYNRYPTFAQLAF
jgi:hypothetical protein